MAGAQCPPDPPCRPQVHSGTHVRRRGHLATGWLDHHPPAHIAGEYHEGRGGGDCQNQGSKQLRSPCLVGTGGGRCTKRWFCCSNLYRAFGRDREEYVVEFVWRKFEFSCSICEPRWVGIHNNAPLTAVGGGAGGPTGGSTPPVSVASNLLEFTAFYWRILHFTAFCWSLLPLKNFLKFDGFYWSLLQSLLEFNGCYTTLFRPFTYDVHLEAISLFLVLLSSQMYGGSSSSVLLQHIMAVPRWE